VSSRQILQEMPPGVAPAGAREIPVAGRSGREIVAMRKRLLAWFDASFRDLPWRRDRDPYLVWLAEIMLQQTRITAVIPYYERFLKRFPTLKSLAKAGEASVLAQWSGLGYYNRARHLHRAAKLIVQRHRGKFPRTVEDALALPGIGRYTAAAILSIAYAAPLPALDGNVSRVLARLDALPGGVREPAVRRALEQAAAAMMESSRPGDWNQALMELGETICTPRAPRCAECPFEKWCHARALGLTAEIPGKGTRRAIERVHIASAILLNKEGQTLLVRETGGHDDPIFSRLWMFPCVRVARSAERELRRHLEEDLRLHVPLLLPLGTARHAVTFRDITLRPFLAPVEKMPAYPASRHVPLEGLGRLPVSSATRKLAHAAWRGLLCGIQNQIEWHSLE
jgi:A/G-specific adenine glycosylase